MPGFAELALVQGMSYLSSAQEATAHNIANATTTGFKRRIAIATQEQAPFESMLDANLPVSRFRQVTSHLAGEPDPTGDRNHLAVLTPDRYVALREPSGAIYYARTGVHRLDAQGQLVNNRGDVYLDETGQPILLGNGDTSPASWTINEDGSIVDDETLLPFGQRIAVFADTDLALRPAGENRFVDSGPKAGSALLPLADRVDVGREPARISQGVLERSNVDVTGELVQMLTVQRSFESLSRALGTLGRIQQAYASSLNR